MKLINATGVKSILGTVVKQSESKDGGFVYATGVEKGDIYVVAEAGVAHGALCYVVNSGVTPVLVSGTFKAGNTIRVRYKDDKKMNGVAFKATDDDVPYLKVGRVLKDTRNGLVDVDLDIQYIHELNSYGTAWDDLRAPASGINPAGQVAPPSVNSTDGSLTFNTNDAVCVWFQLPHAWKEGTDLKLHVHWSKSTSAAGTVNWQTKYKWFNRGDVAPGFSGLVSGTEETANSNTANKHAVLHFPVISGTGKTISSMICIYLIRTLAGDSYGAAANLYEIDIHYQIDSVGSRSEHVK